MFPARFRGSLASAPSGAPDAGIPVEPDWSCYPTHQSGKPTTLCSPADSGTNSDACSYSDDCADGYGCVVNGGAGVCRHFCCGGDSVCQQPNLGLTGTTCAVRPLEDISGQVQMVPVCVPAGS